MLRKKLAMFGLMTVAVSGSEILPVSAQGRGVVVLAAEFGSLGDKRKLEITRRLQQLCGSGSDRCDVFCSETSFGLYDLGRKPICRVSYRCPDGSTRAAEAAREEPIMLRCRDEEDPAATAAETTSTPAR